MKRLITLLGVCCFAFGFFLLWFVPSAWFAQPDAKAVTLTIEIPSGSSASRVATLLEEKGIIASSLGYELYAHVDSSTNSPRAGSYKLQNGMNYHAIARELAAGPARDEVSIQIIEGWSMVEESKAVADAGGKWASPVVGDWVQDYPFLSSLSNKATLEGYLFPDTYRVWKDQLPGSLVKKQLDNFVVHEPTLEQEAKKQGRTMQQVMTLASIVEKEVADPAQRKIVAGIFMRRLKEGMPLQSDATVNYVTHAGHARATAEDLKTDSPYNTYKYPGLPPGPICNPGAEAIEAALHPAETPYRYFLTDDKGKMYYAKTFDEHQANARKAYGP